YDAAWEAGIVNVAASGNSGLRGISAPAKYDSVIAVGATDAADRVASFSSYGPQLELCAPGVGVYSTFGSSGYNDLNGTSMAAPHVTGVAALIIGAGVVDANGNGRINDEVRLRLQATARDIGAAGLDERSGWGVVDAGAVGGGCAVDLDASGTLDIFDFLLFQNLFGAGDMRADFSGDGALDLFDFLAFQNAFALGCI
ncbi:MAG: S8 family serine peptidase, partial [Phycisphaerales bacterium JB039]